MKNDKENHFVEINRQLWNKRTEYHVNSAFYDTEGFLKGKSSLNPIERNLLGNIQGKSILHLQCHFGQDTISLAREGAVVTGIDLSDQAIAAANNLAKTANAKAEFICCNVYDLPRYLDQKFDIVYTSYGTIGWLPDLDRWAEIISRYLKPGGQFIFVEFHPVIWMFDDDFNQVRYNYFNSGAIIETEDSTYADHSAPIHLESVSWNHSIGEVMNSLMKNGLQVVAFDEYDYSPYDCFKHTVEAGLQKYRIRHLENRIPMVYSLVAEKKSNHINQ